MKNHKDDAKKMLNEKPKLPIIVAVDGPAGSGKSSVCASVCRSLGWCYVNTGIIYRALGARIIALVGRHTKAMAKANPNTKLPAFEFFTGKAAELSFVTQTVTQKSDTV